MEGSGFNASIETAVNRVTPQEFNLQITKLDEYLPGGVVDQASHEDIGRPMVRPEYQYVAHLDIVLLCHHPVDHGLLGTSCLPTLNDVEPV